MAHFRSASTGSTHPFDKMVSVRVEHPNRASRYGTRDYDPRGTSEQRQTQKHRQKKKQRQHDQKVEALHEE